MDVFRNVNKINVMTLHSNFLFEFLRSLEYYTLDVVLSKLSKSTTVKTYLHVGTYNLIRDNSCLFLPFNQSQHDFFTGKNKYSFVITVKD